MTEVFILRDILTECQAEPLARERCSPLSHGCFAIKLHPVVLASCQTSTWASSQMREILSILTDGCYRLRSVVLYSLYYTSVNCFFGLESSEAYIQYSLTPT